MSSSISGLTLNTDYFYSPNGSWEYYLKHEIDASDNIINSYVCFKNIGTEYCLQGGDSSYYSTNKSLLLNSSFSGITCSDHTSYVLCVGNNINVGINNDGLIQIDPGTTNCNNLVNAAGVGEQGESGYVSIPAISCYIDV